MRNLHPDVPPLLLFDGQLIIVVRQINGMTFDRRTVQNKDFQSTLNQINQPFSSQDMSYARGT
jgi:hypothetical protein